MITWRPPDVGTDTPKITISGWSTSRTRYVPAGDTADEQGWVGGALPTADAQRAPPETRVSMVRVVHNFGRSSGWTGPGWPSRRDHHRRRGSAGERCRGERMIFELEPTGPGALLEAGRNLGGGQAGVHRRVGRHGRRQWSTERWTSCSTRSMSWRKNLLLGGQPARPGKSPRNFSPMM